MARYWRHKSAAPLVYSDISRIKKTFTLSGNRRSIAAIFRQVLFYLRLGALTLFILALARPQAELISSDVYSEGVDIIMTLDVSGSMNLIDLDVQNRRTRIDVTLEAAKAFMDGRKYDRIGLLVFASEAFLQCPLTLDYGIVKNFLDQVRIGMVPETSTAIGNAVTSALNRLRHSAAKSKVVVLITDGANNAGQIDPLTAAEMAKTLDVKIYAIGVGGRGVPYIIQEDPFFGKHMVPYPEAERIDETSLRKMAQMTNGRYFRAADAKGLKDIFHEIDTLEKTKIIAEGHRRFRELFPYFLTSAMGILLMEVVSSQTRFRKLP